MRTIRKGALVSDTCDSPIPLGRLADHWLGDTELGDEAEIEEHVFACDTCAERLQWIHEAGAALVAFARQGVLPITGTTALLNRFSRDGLNVRHYRLLPGQTVQCTVRATDDFLVAHLVVEHESSAPLDLAVEDDQGQQLARIPNVTIDRRHGEVVSIYPARIALDGPSVGMQLRLLSQVDDREVASYLLQHSAMDDA